jgi:hypothetical protein
MTLFDAQNLCVKNARMINQRLDTQRGKSAERAFSDSVSIALDKDCALIAFEWAPAPEF